MICRRLIIIALAAIFALLWAKAGGNTHAAVVFNGQVVNYQAKQIYTSPQSIPKYTAWVGLWQMPNNVIQCGFTQITGPVSAPVCNAPVIQSTNDGGTWAVVNPDLPATLAVANPRSPAGYYQNAPDACRGMWVSADGQTMVRPVLGVLNSDGWSQGYVQRSTNGGTTWGQPISLPAGNYGSYNAVYPTLIKQVTLGNGASALALMAGCCPSSYSGTNPGADLLKNIFISTDQGQTWGNPIQLMPQSAGVCEESDCVQLASGNLMFIHRAEHYSADGSSYSTTLMESTATLSGQTFVPQTPSGLPWGFSGFPCELMTREGVILDLEMGGSHYSIDGGTTWQNLLTPDGSQLCTYDYPQAVEMADGTIVVVGHRGSDDPYASANQAIMQQTFRLPDIAPEPSVLTLLGTGVGGILFYVWRRRVGRSRQ